jgi:predicted pyridoxine 5'-phosphate oxidase superfamily flavin-nucleotide-binding protein
MLARKRFHTEAKAERLQSMIDDRLSLDMAAFMQSQPFFFMATADADGNCDCSYRGRQHRPPAAPDPLLRVLDDRTLVFPDYPGNNLFNSLGNLLVNPGIGLLFIDFTNPRRLRVNGRALVRERVAEDGEWWPSAPRMVEVAIHQVFPNCRARIPTLVPADGLHPQPHQ